MSARDMKKVAQDQWKKTVERGETNYSAEVLAFAYTFGLPPSECEGMYVESDWKQEWIDDYDALVSEIQLLKKSGKR